MAEELPIQSLLSVLWIVLFGVMFFYGQKIQMFMTLRSISGKLHRLERMKNDARSQLLTTLAKHNSGTTLPQDRVDRMLEFFLISPVNLDPSGIVKKMEHVFDGYEQTLKDEVKTLAPQADESQVNTLSNLLEVSLGLNLMFRVVRHYYLSGKRLGNLLAVFLLQMALPMIMDAAEAYHSSLKAFTEGLTIGDGLGALVASKLGVNTPAQEIVKDTMVSEVESQGRRLLVVKAKGPGGNVGKPGEAVAKLLETYDKVALIITVDAALRLEGEASGQIAEGIGAAIGGPGVERYKIEETATKKQVPLLAMVVKMSEKEALTSIKPELKGAADEVVKRIEKAVLENAQPGDTVIVAGIGNTLGIA